MQTLLQSKHSQIQLSKDTLILLYSKKIRQIKRQNYIQKQTDSEHIRLKENNFLAIQQSQIELRRSFLNQSRQKKIIDSIQQNQSLYLNSENKKLNFDQTIQGPQILNYQMRYNCRNQDSSIFENKIRYSKLNLVQQQEISEVQFISKSNRDGKGQTYKTLACMNYDQIGQYFKLVKKFFNLDHQNIRTIIGYNIEDPQETNLSGQICILTQKYNYNLRTFLQKNKISTKEKWHMAVQIIDAIYYLHQNEVIFCNLHPNNILIDGDTRMPVIIDFDLQFDKDYLIQNIWPNKQLKRRCHCLQRRLTFIQQDASYFIYFLVVNFNFRNHSTYHNKFYYQSFSYSDLRDIPRFESSFICKGWFSNTTEFRCLTRKSQSDYIKMFKWRD
ncbi:unnamed protein product (macronuclear) [Paramecium tetraurelia]|uniref:Protein kinase domain-containing protein n=1 Tax=Paramecium tetraurelia TaxID=5888 RepID=A0DCY0_PARTE|nr:uncharacterized protein GSPATT00015756001 [Paramecium tetraurelia]CAK80897.1 unnamed protein product [Paramecium tetraurelia]|eukprot:XP_001448294.1 hypothetical protein (macronuclear) [Paramecium tetraurelia strain d4-2]